MAYAYSADKYQDLWISTKAYFSSKAMDTLQRSHPLLSKIAGNNNVKAVALQGKRFVQPILARAVENVKAIQYDDDITVTSVKLLESTEIEPKCLYQGVPIYSQEIAVNNSAQLLDLMKLNQQAMRAGFTRSFARALYANGATAQDMNGLAYMLSENPYKLGLVVYNLLRGGTLGDSQEFWRNRAGEWVEGATTPTGAVKWPDTKDAQAQALVQAMTDMLLVLNGVSEVGDFATIKPITDGIYMNYVFYSLFQYARYNILHINNVASEKIDMGFTKLEHMGVPVYLDKNCPMNKIYFLDSSQIKLLHIPGQNFAQIIKPMPTKFGDMHFTIFNGNFMIENARNCGVITKNSAATNGLPLPANVCAGLANYQDKNYDPVVDSITAFGDTTFDDINYSGTGKYHPHAAPPDDVEKKSANSAKK